jgi:dephospho-CoA kinase
MSTTRSLYVVGLTGGVGSGKSTAANHFAKLGAFVVDVDDISRALTTSGGTAVEPVLQAFPRVEKHGEIDRAALREIVFSDASARKKLESILHPLIRTQTTCALKSEAACNAPYALLVVPLLFESNAYADFIECAVVVDVPVEKQIERVVTTRGVPAEVARGIVAAQLPRESRLARAQFAIDNSGGREALNAQVARLHEVLLANATDANEIANANHANEIAREAVL